MKNVITTSITKAKKLAKDFIRNEYNIKRLSYSKFEHTSINCNCGETNAISCIAEIKFGGNWKQITVGICKHCANV
jgi:hypothetical protein